MRRVKMQSVGGIVFTCSEDDVIWTAEELGYIAIKVESLYLEEIRDELKRLLRDYRSDIVYEKLKQL